MKQKHEIVITKEIPDYVKIQMLERLIKMIKEPDEGNFVEFNFKTNLKIDYSFNKKTIKAKIIGNAKSID